METTLLILAVVALVGCGESEEEKTIASATLVGADGTPKAKASAEAQAAAEAKAVPANIADPILERAIRAGVIGPGANPSIAVAPKLTGELTKADLEKVPMLNLYGRRLTEVPKGLEKLTQLRLLKLGANQLTDVKGLEKLTQLRSLSLTGNQLTDVKGLEKLTQLRSLSLLSNPALTKAQIDQLQKALPKCRILSKAQEIITPPR